jgi:hypothetical protein
MTQKGIYIYGIVPNFYGTTQFQKLDNSGVYAITYQNISAIVSGSENDELDYYDRESLGILLVHHQKTIETLQEKGFSMIIPMRLGTIVNSREEVSKILACGYDLIIKTLKEIEYHTEIDLVVTWADFLANIKNVANHPEIMAMKEELLSNKETLSQVDQVKIGMLIQEKLSEKNKTTELKILHAISPFGTDIKMHEVMNDEMVTNSAFLLKRTNSEKFEAIVDLLDEEYKGLLNFKLVGPLPCYSFFTLEAKELSPELVNQAGKELGLKEETSESEIKKAYLEKAKVFHPDACAENVEEGGFSRIHNAYQILLDYASAVRQSSKEGLISLVKEKMNGNLMLVKIKE